MINDDGFLIMEGYTIQFLNFVFGTQWPKNPISRSSTMSIIPKWDTQSDSTVVDWRICNIFPCTIAMISNGETLIFLNHVYIEFYLSWLYRIKQNVVGWFSPANLPSQLLFPWFSHDFPMISHDFPMLKPMFPMIFLCFPMFPMIFLCFPMFSLIFLCFPMVFLISKLPLMAIPSDVASPAKVATDDGGARPCASTREGGAGQRCQTEHLNHYNRWFRCNNDDW